MICSTNEMVERSILGRYYQQMPSLISSKRLEGSLFT